MDHLDEVSVTIRDDHPRGGSQIAGGPSAQEVAQVIWGPYRLTPSVDGADSIGRSLPPRPLRLGDDLVFALERSLPPKWNRDHAGWRNQYDSTPVRLEITCRREGHAPWVIPREVEVTGHAPRVRFIS